MRTDDRVNAVIFDMDGVLVLSEDAHFRSWRDTAAAYGARVSHELFLSCFGRTNPDCIRTMIGEVSPERAHEIAERKELAYRDIVRSDMPLAPGVRELLGSLRAAGVCTAIGSSAPPENVELLLDVGGLREHFAAAVNGSMVSRGKPAPDVFLRAGELLGVHARECAVIEDAPAGIVAARAAGMLAVAVATTHTPAQLVEAGAHHVFPSLASVPRHLLGVLQGS